MKQKTLLGNIGRLILSFALLILITVPTRAEFVLVFDDPDTPEEEFRIVDEGENDMGSGVGHIQYSGPFGQNQFTVFVTALSKDWTGFRPPLGPDFPEDAEFTVNINLFRSEIGRSMNVRLTDTDYSAGNGQADAYINTAIGSPFGPDGSESIQFKFYGDSANAEFGNSFDIGASEVIESPADENLIGVSGPTESIGSLTMETLFVANGLSEGGFTAVLAMVPSTPTEPKAPFITRHPDPASVDVGDAVGFVVEALGTAPLTYQWQFNGVNLGGETNPALALVNVQQSQAGDYQVLVSNAAGSDLSDPATLTVVETGERPEFTMHPRSQQAVLGETVSFTTTATGTPPLHYEWAYGNESIGFTLIPGETSATLTLENVQFDQAGKYRAIVNNSYGTDSSAVAVLVVIDPGSPVITDQPDDQTVDVGDTVSFSVAATGTDPLSYQWFRNGTPLSGENASTLTLSNVQTSNTGVYQVLVSNPVGVELSDEASLIVKTAPGAEPPTITEHPQDQIVAEGETATFTVAATGTAPLSYQWYKDGIEVSGEVSDTLTLSNVQLEQEAAYSVIVQNAQGSDLSDPGTLQVETVPTVIVDGTTVTRIEDLAVRDRWGTTTVYDVDFLYDTAETVYGSELEFDLPGTDSSLGVKAVNDAINATTPRPTGAGPQGEGRFHVGSFDRFNLVNAAAGDYLISAWTSCELDCIGGVTTLPSDEIVTWAKFTIATAEPDPPTMTIVSSAANEVTISWSPATAGFVLQETTDVASGNWTNSPSGDTNPVTIQTSGSARYYKLRN